MAAVDGPPASGDADVRNQILMVVRNASGVDFGEYKPSTVERRLARRMALRRAQDEQAYLTLLQGDPAEARALYEDILIHVTSFFRDPAVFDVLESQILPAVLKDKPEGRRSESGWPGAPLAKRCTRSRSRSSKCSESHRARFRSSGPI